MKKQIKLFILALGLFVCSVAINSDARPYRSTGGQTCTTTYVCEYSVFGYCLWGGDVTTCVAN